ncbi:hypothetical protein Ancab_014070 [Ancistrocladus abbreviatus]
MEATARGTYPTVSTAGGTRYRSNNDEFGHEQREARYYVSIGEDARLPGSQIGDSRHRKKLAESKDEGSSSSWVMNKGA